MTDLAIHVENLGKRYKIGALQKRHDTLRDALAGAFKRLNVPTLERSNDAHIWALKDVSFDVKRGEVVGIIGRNGAGKSTLLKILSRITKPTEGLVDIHGRVGSLLEVGTGFHPELTGRENIYLNGAILGMHRVDIDRKFDEIVAFAEIEKFIDTPVKHYSSGMYVRLAFAVAAHLEPEILLVDEVLAVGDAAFQKKCLGKMGDVAKEGRTILFVSHNLEAIQRICQKAMMLEDGRVAQSGNTRDVVEVYFEESQKSSRSAPRFDPQGIFKDIQLTVNNKVPENTVLWAVPTALVVCVSVESVTPMACPKVDLAFYRSDALKLFAVCSDDIIENATSQLQKTWSFEFVIDDVDLAPQKLYLDVGVRLYKASPYLILWQGACELQVGTAGQSYLLTSDSIVWPQCRVTAL
ncbi:MAG: ABC transporter ATP-binding protein [Chloroflexi bacterium]|nr:ABC transporter ATP-binding protein [Chloroflexota bacterium]